MTYILKNAHVEKSGQLQPYSFLVQNNKFTGIQPHFRYSNSITSDLKSYILTPAYVFADGSFPNLSFEDFKQYITTQFLLKGCTTILIPVKLNFEYEWKSKLLKMRTQLIGSPIDYVLSVRIPLRVLSPSLIRKCRKDKVGSLFIELTESSNLAGIPWGWIKEAMFPYNPTFVPHVMVGNEKKRKEILDEWEDVLTEAGIPFLHEPIPSLRPLSKSTLARLGIYPRKGFLHIGGEVSYNLYSISDDKKSSPYDSNKLCVTVNKGAVIRAGEQCWYQSGAGSELKIRVPQFFNQVTS